jgi:hypothetical protein
MGRRVRRRAVDLSTWLDQTSILFLKQKNGKLLLQRMVRESLHRCGAGEFRRKQRFDKEQK